MQGTEKPQHDQDYDQQTKYAAQTASAISTVCVVSAAAAKQQDKNDNDQNSSHDFLTSGCVLRTFPVRTVS